MQTKKQSLIESLTNTVIGFVISYASTFAILPLVGLKTSAGTNLLITVYFTVISIIRGYVIRRWFNKPKSQPIEELVKEANLKIAQEATVPVWLHCFSCEIEMTVIEYKGELCCKNCGLIHR